MPGTDYSSLLNCTYGTSVLEVWDYTYDKQGGIRDLLGRMVDEFTLEMSCQFRDTDAGDFVTQIGNITADLAKDGRDFTINGINNEVEVQLLAARTENGGPHISDVKMSSGDTALCKIITFTVKATTLLPAGAQPQTHAYKVTTNTRPDNLDRVVRTGEVHGPDAANYFVQEVVPLAQAVYALPYWVVDYSFETGMAGILNRLNYTLNARQNFGPLPQVVDAANVSNGTAVDGEVTMTNDRDENQRMVITAQFDLLVTGDPQKLISKIQTTMPKGLIYKQAYALKTIQEQRLTGSFTVLQSGDQSPLLNWTETLKIRRAVDRYELKTYPGVGPLLVKANESISEGTQSGEAIAVGKFPKEPPPLPGYVMAEEPDVAFTDMNNVEKKTTWTYEFWFYGQTGSLGDPNGGQGAIDPLAGNLALAFLARSTQTGNGYRASDGLNP